MLESFEIPKFISLKRTKHLLGLFILINFVLCSSLFYYNFVYLLNNIRASWEGFWILEYEVLMLETCVDHSQDGKNSLFTTFCFICICLQPCNSRLDIAFIFNLRFIYSFFIYTGPMILFSIELGNYPNIFLLEWTDPCDDVHN